MAAGEGLVSIIPSSISYTGTSATLGSDGTVEFSSVTALTLEDVFSAAYTNYRLSVSITSTSGGYVTLQYRTGGTTASGTDYTQQYIDVNNTAISANRGTGATSGRVIYDGGGLRTGSTTFIYGPYLAAPTIFRTASASDSNNARLEDWIVSHSLSTSYESCSFGLPSGATGRIKFFGYEE